MLPFLLYTDGLKAQIETFNDVYHLFHGELFHNFFSVLMALIPSFTLPPTNTQTFYLRDTNPIFPATIFACLSVSVKYSDSHPILDTQSRSYFLLLPFMSISLYHPHSIATPFFCKKSTIWTCIPTPSATYHLILPFCVREQLMKELFIHTCCSIRPSLFLF